MITRYTVKFLDNTMTTVESDGITWGYSAVRFWNGESESKGKLVKAINMSIIASIEPTADQPEQPVAEDSGSGKSFLQFG